MEKTKMALVSDQLFETGEENLAMLIKEAGKSARIRKKKKLWMSILRDSIWQNRYIVPISNGKII